MMTQPLPMRLIARMEAYLPKVAPARPVPSARRGRVWATVAAVMPSLTLAIIQVVMHRSVLAGSWPAWRPVLLDLAVVAAGATLVAAVAAGLHAWRNHA